MYQLYFGMNSLYKTRKNKEGLLQKITLHNILVTKYVQFVSPFVYTQINQSPHQSTHRNSVLISENPLSLNHRIIELQNHRIIKWPGSEGSLKISCFQSSFCGQEQFSLDQVAQSLSQSGLEHSQRCDICNFSGQPIPMPRLTFVALGCCCGVLTWSLSLFFF